MIVRLTQNGTSLYVNTDQVAIISPHPQLINQTNVTLAGGINVLVEGAASEIAQNMNQDKRILIEG